MFALARVLPVHFANCLNIPNAPELHRVGLDLNSVQLERIQNWQEKGGRGESCSDENKNCVPFSQQNVIFTRAEGWLSFWMVLSF